MIKTENEMQSILIFSKNTNRLFITILAVSLPLNEFNFDKNQNEGKYKICIFLCYLRLVKIFFNKALSQRTFFEKPRLAFHRVCFATFTPLQPNRTRQITS